MLKKQPRLEILGLYNAHEPRRCILIRIRPMWNFHSKYVRYLSRFTLKFVFVLLYPTFAFPLTLSWVNCPTALLLSIQLINTMVGQTRFIILLLQSVIIAEVALGASQNIALFGGSVYLGGPWDLEPNVDGPGTPSRCISGVEILQREGIKHVQFVPTFYWMDSGPKNPPPNFDYSCQNANLSTYYCYSRFNATTVTHWCYLRDNGACHEVTPSEMQQFKDSFSQCVQRAVDLGLDITVNVRVDDGRNLGGWRNTLDFSPVQTFGSYSYEEAIINPIVDVLIQTAKNTTEIDFTLQGEMGATVFFYPQEWQTVINRTYDRLSAARGPGAAPTKIGLGLNNLKLCGCEYIGIVNAYQYLAKLNSTFDPSIYNLTAIKDVLGAADYIGISAYIPMPSPNFAICDFEGLLIRMDDEMSFYNISLGELNDVYGTKIHFAEFGVGGGTSQNGDKMATTAAEAAYTPFFGISGRYGCDKDPFRMCYLNEPSPVRDYRRYYYSAASEYLKQNGCRYHGIKNVFVWGTGSWNVFADYTGDFGPNGRNWSDPVVLKTISEHNAFAMSS